MSKCEGCGAPFTRLLTTAALYLLSAACSGQPSIPVRPSPGGTQDRERVFVESITLTEVSESVLSSLNIGAVVRDSSVAAGIQKAADVWGFQLDLFVESDPRERIRLMRQLVERGDAALILDDVPDAVLGDVAALAESRIGRRPGERRVPIVQVRLRTSNGRLVPGADSIPASNDPYSDGFGAVRAVRAKLLPLIPKYQESLPIMFPISPLPDNFFQPTKFPYPEPVIRSTRTVSSRSASAHAHTSCHAAALLGNMIHRTSDVDRDIFLIGFEGGNLSTKALPGAVTNDKLSAVMTSYVWAIRGLASETRDLLSENDGLPTSHFRPSVHRPEELRVALEGWQRTGRIEEFELVGNEELILKKYHGATRRFRTAFFMVSYDKHFSQPRLEEGVDAFGRHTFELTSTQQFVQLFTEVPLEAPQRRAGAPTDVLGAIRLADSETATRLSHDVTSMIAEPIIQPRQPRGGMLTRAGASVGSIVGFPLGSILQRVRDTSPPFQPYIMTVEGGFLVVTPEQTITEADMRRVMTRFDFDERGPLGSDQTITVSFTDGRTLVFRRTILAFGQLDSALSVLVDQAMIGGWEYVGARGRGLAANVLLMNFLGKHRKFMSSLNTWPSDDRPGKPYIRFYVDGMQRLNFSLITREGWRQEFVEVPIAMPPIPRDVELFTGVSTLP